MGVVPFTWAGLAADTLRSPDAVAPGARAQFYIHHTTQYAPMGPLDLDRAANFRPVRHTLELRVPQVFLQDLARDPVPRGAWQRLAGWPGVETEKRAQNDPRYEFAPSGGSLFWGSLFWFERLGVHPAFQGQHLGARLLAQALWVLPRRPDDLALMEVMPTECAFGGPEPVRTRAAILRLTRYYERLGLSRWTRRRAPRALPVGMTVDDGGAEIPAPVLYHLGSEVLEFARAETREETRDEDAADAA
jgi:GNAT superfamily N-acetyltransferase